MQLPSEVSYQPLWLSGLYRLTVLLFIHFHEPFHPSLFLNLRKHVFLFLIMVVLQHLAKQQRILHKVLRIVLWHVWRNMVDGVEGSDPDIVDEGHEASHVDKAIRFLASFAIFVERRRNKLERALLPWKLCRA